MANLWRFVVTLSVVTGCVGAGPPGEETHGAHEAGTTAEHRPWVGHTPSGDVVHVTPDGVPAVGSNRFVISVDPTSSPPRSVDLVSPEMPMHGVIRLPAERQGDAWVAQVDVPMAGEWVLYVNVDDGTNAAAFPFTVAAVVDDSANTHAVHRH